ncbi:MAG: hypothetical protein II661_08405 [Bacteroidales bacterium]|nr:hypothetical protein [Bacteroidales bacterium]
MTRKFGPSEAYRPIEALSGTRYRICFDFVPFPDDNTFGYWSENNYFTKPSTEQVKEDVINGTIARYRSEGLEPPKEIDTSEYVIDGDAQKAQWEEAHNSEEL